jgi:hypothetical protein
MRWYPKQLRAGFMYESFSFYLKAVPQLFRVLRKWPFLAPYLYVSLTIITATLLSQTSCLSFCLSSWLGPRPPPFSWPNLEISRNKFQNCPAPRLESFWRTSRLDNSYSTRSIINRDSWVNNLTTAVAQVVRPRSLTAEALGQSL